MAPALQLEQRTGIQTKISGIEGNFVQSELCQRQKIHVFIEIIGDISIKKIARRCNNRESDRYGRDYISIK